MRQGFTPIEAIEELDSSSPASTSPPAVAEQEPQEMRPMRAGFTPLSELEAAPATRTSLTPEQAQAARKQMMKDEALNSPPVAVAETAANLLSQSVALPVAGLAGLATEAGRALGLTQREGADVVRQVGEALTYQPRGSAGQKAVEVITWPFQKLAEGGEWAGKRTLALTGSPGAATAVDVAINSLPMVVAPAWKAGKRATKAGTQASPEPSPATPQAAPEVTPQVTTQAAPQPSAAVGAAPDAMVKMVTEPTAVPFRRPGFTPLEQLDAEQAAANPETRLPAERLDVEQPPALRPESVEPVQGQALPSAVVGELAGPDPGLPAAPVAVRGGTDAGAVTGAGADAFAAPDLATGGAAVAMESVAGPAVGTGMGMGMEAAAAPAPRTARYALLEADSLKASHDVNLRETPDFPAALQREGWTRAEAEQRVQAITRDLDPRRLVDAIDDADGAPVVSAEGMVEAGNARAIALQRIYQANGEKAQMYRDHLMEQAPRLGLDAQTVATMNKPVLVRLPDEPAMRYSASEPPVQNAAAGWAPGANYVGAIDDARLPAASDARTWSGERAAPIRREEIIEPFAHALGASVYEGRIKEKRVLGFFRPRNEEVRIKRHADLETTAHELAHLIDHRFPEVKKSWGSGPGWQERRAELKGLSYDSKKINEGFAEFVRHWMTQPEVAATRAPKFSAWFEDFVGRNPHRKAIEQARDGMTAWFGQSALDRARSKIGEPLSDAAYSRWDAFRQTTLDDLHGVYRMERELREGKIEPNGAYESARLTRASASIADGAVRHGAPVRKPDGSYTFTGRGLQDILKPVADNLEDSLLYFVGRSSRELLAQGREHLFTPAEIDAMLKLRTPQREQAFKDYQAWNSAILDFAQEHGVINPQARQLWQRTAYLPFHRVGQPEGFKGKPGDWSGVKALTGGTENLRDVLGNMVQNAAMLIDKAVKNEARAKIAALADEPGQGGARFMARIAPESRPVKVSTEATVEAIIKGMGLDGKSPEAQKVRDMLASAPNMLEVLQGNMPPAGGNVVAVLKEGKPVWYEVADPLLLRALESIDRPLPPAFMKWLTLPKRIGQTTVTMTPDFMVANLARDTLMGGIMSRAGFRPVLDSLQGMRMRQTNDPLYRDFIANGGGLSSMFLDEGKFRAKLAKFYQREGIDLRTVINTPEKVLGFVETLADAVETSTRLGEYRRAVQAGEHPRHAAYLGREVSTDFAMRGDGKTLGFFIDTVMFLRPALASWDRMYRGVSHDANRGAIATKAGLLAAMSATLYLVNREDSRYQALPDWDRDAHWHFFVGQEHFRYPKIFEIGALASAAERTVEKTLDEDVQGLGKDFARILGATFGVNVLPQIIAPLKDQATNKTGFTGALIETPGMEDLQPFMRAKPTTSETLRAMGMATRDLPEALQVNPVRAEALLRGYFNTWAMYGLALTDEAFFSGTKPQMRTDQLPVVRRFYSQEPPLRTKWEDQFYDVLGEAKRLRGTLRELDRQGRQDVADEKEKASLAGEATPLQHAAKSVADVNAQMRQVRRDDTLSPADKRAQLDALTVERNDLLRRAVQEHKAAMKLKEDPNK